MSLLKMQMGRWTIVGKSLKQNFELIQLIHLHDRTQTESISISNKLREVVEYLLKKEKIRYNWATQYVRQETK